MKRSTTTCIFLHPRPASQPRREPSSYTHLLQLLAFLLLSRFNPPDEVFLLHSFGKSDVEVRNSSGFHRHSEQFVHSTTGNPKIVCNVLSGEDVWHIIKMFHGVHLFHLHRDLLATHR